MKHKTSRGKEMLFVEMLFRLGISIAWISKALGLHEKAVRRHLLSSGWLLSGERPLGRQVRCAVELALQDPRLCSLIGCGEQEQNVIDAALYDILVNWLMGHHRRKSRVEDDIPFSPSFYKLVEQLELSTRTANCLRKIGAGFVFDVVQLQEGDLLRQKNFGKASLKELRDVLAGSGLTLGMRLEGRKEKREFATRNRVLKRLLAQSPQVLH